MQNFKIVFKDFLKFLVEAKGFDGSEVIFDGNFTETFRLHQIQAKKFISFESVQILLLTPLFMMNVNGLQPKFLKFSVKIFKKRISF